MIINVKDRAPLPVAPRHHQYHWSAGWGHGEQSAQLFLIESKRPLLNPIRTIVILEVH